MAKPDLTFTNDGVFVTFYAETEAGKDAMRLAEAVYSEAAQ